MSDNKHLTPVWIIYIDGKRLDTEHEGALRSITIHDRLNGISTFTIRFETAEVKLAEKGVLSLESEISIHLGYKDDVAEVFKGEITGLAPKSPEYDTDYFEVTGANVLHRLTHGEHCRHFENQKPSEIIKGILDDFSLKAKVEDFGGVCQFSSQPGITNYDYLLEAARTYGKEFFADGDTVYVKDEISIRNDEIILEWGKSLIQFEMSQDIKKQISGCTYVGWDPLKRESFEATVGMADIPVKVGGSKDWTTVSKSGSGNLVSIKPTHEILDAEDARARALGLLQRTSYKFYHGTGKAEGNYKLRPGMRVTVKMIGDQYEGEYIADAVAHRFNRTDGYTTEVKLKRNMAS